MASKSGEPMYTAEQIRIPPELPQVLKDFIKAAIRTQPTDILAWSAAYFQALEKGELPPVNERLDLPGVGKKLSKEKLVILERQLGDRQTVHVDELQRKWQDLGCEKDQLDDLLSIGNFPDDDIPWLKFFGLACSTFAAGIPNAMNTACHILSRDDPGGSARIPLDTFMNLYRYLALLDRDVSQEQVEAVAAFLAQQASQGAGLVGPRNLGHRDCPKLGPVRV